MKYMGDSEWWNERFKDRGLKIMIHEKRLEEDIIYFPKKGKILDIACGDGRNAIYLARLGYEVLAVDFCEEALERLNYFIKKELLEIETKLVDLSKDESWYSFIAFSKETNEFIGTCSIAPETDSKHWDLGYCVHKKYWRQGYATEMIKALINFGYEKGGRKFTADVAKQNSGSNGVLKKLGFSIEKEGTFKKTGTDIIYSNYTYKLELE